MAKVIKYYEVVRYFYNGFKPILIQSDLTLDEAKAICTVNNAKAGEDGHGNPWADIFQAKGLF